MNINHLASAFYRQSWLIDYRFAESYMPLVERFLSGEKVAFFGDAEDSKTTIEFVQPDGSMISFRLTSSDLRKGGLFSDAADGSIAILPIEGVILQKDGMCGEVGTETMGMWMRDAASAKNISSIIQNVNSPGGQVSGTKEFAGIIKDTRKIKTVRTVTTGLMASAGYWLGMMSDEVYASSETVEIGSIGTCIRFRDSSAMMKERGIVEHTINADSSPHKNLDFKNALKGDYSALIENVLNPTNDVFMNEVEAERGSKLKKEKVTIDGKDHFEPLTGKVYVAQAAKEKGLIDDIQSFDNVLDKSFEQAKGSKSYSYNKNSNMFGNKFPKTSALAKVAVADLNQPMLDAANTELAEAEITGVSLVLDSELETAAEAVKKVPVLEASIVSKDAEILKLTNTVAEQKKKLNAPAEEPGTPAAKADEQPEGEKPVVDNFETSFDREVKGMFN